MCISDWQLGRLLRSQMWYRDLDAGLNDWPANPLRVGFFVYMLNVIPDCFLQFRVQGSFRTYHNIADNDTFIELTLKEHGDVIQNPIRLTTGAAPDFALIVELTMPAEYLLVPPETFEFNN